MSEQHLDAWEPTDRGTITIGRYLLHRQIARGGMATIHIARLMGDEGFSRIVAAKRLLPEFAEDSEFVAMFLDEARVASKVHHPNVVPVLDVVTTGEEVVLVQEYVHGAPLHYLLRQAHQNDEHVPVNIAVSIACQIAAGLQAAHDTVDEMGMPLNIVHRDVSPQNIMISLDGSARLLDFGVAKATMAAHTTRENTFKGKLAYSAPEQLRGAAVRQSDIYALGIVLWELIVGRRMHGTAQSEGELVATIMAGALPRMTDALADERDRLGKARWRQLEQVDAVVKKALAVDLRERYQTASDMEAALNGAVIPAAPTEVATWLRGLGREFVEKNEAAIRAEEASWRRTTNPGFNSISRRTPIPGTLRTVSSGGRMASHSDTSTANGAQAYARENSHRRTNKLVYVLGALVILLGFGIVFVMVGSGSQASSAAARAPDPSPPAPAARTVTVPATVPATAPAPAPTATPPAPPSTQAVVEQPAVPIEAPAPIEPPKPAPPPPPVVKKAPPPVVRQQPARQPPQVVRKAPTPTPPPPPTPTPTKVETKVETPVTPPAPPAPTNDCNPPYYFSGQKKIFKPQCI